MGELCSKTTCWVVSMQLLCGHHITTLCTPAREHKESHDRACRRPSSIYGRIPGKMRPLAVVFSMISAQRKSRISLTGKEVLRDGSYVISNSN